MGAVLDLIPVPILSSYHEVMSVWFWMLGISILLSLLLIGQRRQNRISEEINAKRVRRELNSMPCPRCAEDVLLEAKVCRHCGEDVAEAASLEQARRDKLRIERNIARWNTELRIWSFWLIIGSVVSLATVFSLLYVFRDPAVLYLLPVAVVVVLPGLVNVLKARKRLSELNG